MQSWQTVVLLMAITSAVVLAQSSSSDCSEALGMSQGLRKIPDTALKANSNYYSNNLLAYSARLDGPSAWCPAPLAANQKSAYLEIDLSNIHRITAIDTQGRYANGYGNEYTEKFSIDYWDTYLEEWRPYRSSSGLTEFKGNTNTFKAVRTNFMPAIITNMVRIFPLTDESRTVCMRLELYGCMEQVNEIIINAPSDVKSVEEAAENCNTVMGLDDSSVPSTTTSWCSIYPVYNEMQEWVELDFGNLRRVTAVETQGWYERAYEYAEIFFIHYQRVNSDRWTQYKDRMGNSMFRGSRDPYTAVKNILDPAVVAKKMRVIPYDGKGNRVCLRVTLYGCRWTEAVMSYSMPQGSQFGCADMGSPYFLYDYGYDGLEEDGKLHNGLGQLTDNIEGLSDFAADSGYGKQGYEWIGWSNTTFAGSPVEMVFEFDSVRDFTSVSFHVNNMFSKRAYAFRRALIHFSVGGLNYQDDVVEYNTVKDVYSEQARTISINIVGRVGRYVKVQLYFESPWIMLSEVRFESMPNSMENVFIKFM